MLPVQPPNLTDMSTTASNAASGPISVGGLTFQPAQKGTNDVLYMVAAMLGVIGLAAMVFRRK